MRFSAFLLTAAVSLASLPLHAQGTGSPPAGSPPGATGPKPDTPIESKREPRRSMSLDDLFDRLAKAEDENEAKGIGALIERRWERSGSDTADLLMRRANEAAGKKDYPLAVELLDRVIALQPNWAEAWSQRATVLYQLDDPVAAMVDLHRVLQLEPREYNAWAGLGHIFMASDDKARALEAYRRALKLNPQFPTLKTIVERLSHEVDGLDL
ncbi:tetratricopeptide repeat protein [Microvirga pudoricolor]|uniref:tetratricopeptide repeat protein n=1 Tax=Microvirga pudoricolor TaxID=2778729 RepID=UPI0019501ED4|nr:tetratricopeptide repeat protein [Microvirga pudoricolor]MBM6594928.1 tetratricopeptide repeat protein [Microvirga pudoricolor]